MECRVHILTGKKDVNAQYMILGFYSHSRLLEHLGLARKQWWWLVVVAESERAQLSVEPFFRVDFSSGILETYLTSTTSESSVFTPCFFGSYSAIIGRIGVLCNRTEGDELKRMNYPHKLTDGTSARVIVHDQLVVTSSWCAARGLIKWGRNKRALSATNAFECTDDDDDTFRCS